MFVCRELGAVSIHYFMSVRSRLDIGSPQQCLVDSTHADKLSCVEPPQVFFSVNGLDSWNKEHCGVAHGGSHQRKDY
ncbi:hypothetical protein BDR04DRAFT_1088729 [Suillus decipiens]|nr:hypothetical protein BDR04DRAFT_1088729 [Suillus decipiens]